MNCHETNLRWRVQEALRDWDAVEATVGDEEVSNSIVSRIVNRDTYNINPTTKPCEGWRVYTTVTSTSGERVLESYKRAKGAHGEMRDKKLFVTKPATRTPTDKASSLKDHIGSPPDYARRRDGVSVTLSQGTRKNKMGDL